MEQWNAHVIFHSLHRSESLVIVNLLAEHHLVTGNSFDTIGELWKYQQNLQDDLTTGLIFIFPPKFCQKKTD
jgi:hypothetical protein